MGFYEHGNGIPPWDLLELVVAADEVDVLAQCQLWEAPRTVELWSETELCEAGCGLWGVGKHVACCCRSFGGRVVR